MIRLTFEDLTAGSTTHLAAVQEEINNQANFKEKAVRADLKWRAKRSTTVAKSTFTEIKSKLVAMCSGAEICVYCEHNEATDIEHIFPKRLYPNKCFLWGNYVLVCGKCNTHFKKEIFKIFSPAGSEIIQDTTPKRNVYTEPENDDALFINQRVDDPMDYLELDFLERTFYYIERPATGTREYEKAKFTKELLGLNRREDLVQHRKTAYKFYKGELQRYAAIQHINGMAELLHLTDSFIDIFDAGGEFEVEKTSVLTAIRKRIESHSHPTIWKEMIRQRESLPETNQLFQQVPDAVTW